MLNQTRPRLAFFVCAVLIALVMITVTPYCLEAQGNESESSNSEATTNEQKPFIYFLFGGGGAIGIACTTPIILISFVAMALLLENFFTIRESNLMPPGLAEEVHSLISSGSFSHAEQQCKLKPSFLAAAIIAGLQQVRHGYSAVEKSLEDACHGQASRLFRKIEFLAVVANISTMLGLFGTVVGLVIAFKRVADTGGVARASDLAGGIYLAMMTTVEGLGVAIPCVAAYALFKNKADQLSADTTLMAEYAFSGYRRGGPPRRSESRKKEA